MGQRLLVLLLLLAAAAAAAEAKSAAGRRAKRSGGGGKGKEDLNSLRPETPKSGIEGASFWREYGRLDLRRAARRAASFDPAAVARNVILFVGDGMGVQTVTMARIYKGQKSREEGGETRDGNGEGEEMSWEAFPAAGLSKTYNTDFQVADSAGTATAMFSGVKTRMGTIGVDATVPRNTCDAEAVERGRIRGMLHWAAEAGKDVGFVSTARVTHATPASLYAHSADRNFEADSHINKREDSDKCNKDIAHQLIYSEAGKKIKVAFGGGRAVFQLKEGSSEKDPGKREDEDLTDAYQRIKEKEGKSYRYLKTAEDLKKWEADGGTDYVLGLFAPSHLDYEVDRAAKAKSDSPSLTELTASAVRHLKRQSGERGFFLMVESGRIDHAHHDTNAKRAMEETVEFQKAVAAAMEELGDEQGETLVVVTADHSHAVTINGYPPRGNPILGHVYSEPYTYSHYPDGTKQAYATISYANGPGYFKHFKNDSSVPWMDMRGQDYNDVDFLQPAMVPTGPEDPSETHGGEDVPIYAIGPQAYLLSGVHEQSYIAHVMAYAACVGDYSEDCPRHMDVQCSSAARVGCSIVSLVSSLLLLLWNKFL